VVRELFKAGIVAPGLTFHGLRTTTATMLAEADCDDETIQSVTGHETTAMVAHYRRAADRKRRAARGIASLNFGLAETGENEGPGEQRKNCAATKLSNFAGQGCLTFDVCYALTH